MEFRLGYLWGMTRPDWHMRLFQAIEEDERSDRALSLAAGLGPNYVHQLRQMKHSPKIDAAEKLCAELGVSLMWVLTGVELDREGEELIRLAGDASPSQRHHLIQLLRGPQS